MKQVVICSATLALTLFVAPSYGENWERQRFNQEMMENQSQMYSDDGMPYRVASVEENRRMMLERGGKNSVDYIETMPTTAGVSSIDDIENLPATAAGYPDGRSMYDRDRKHDWRTGHRGRIHHEY
ncbi:hypothetical protein QQF73_16190 [Marinobacter sp. M216]|uniref:DUF4148 domain-containing protein n=1 Tax=Marinobacter albus TaxID=3030833 RepID=A0ABT7HH68_9GAMM|nr:MULTISPECIES: hypothetical protein [unclassified Marinobacter]MBW7472622.1 hypothetical protein [Marinobacter sp. F4218]MDK9559175.1 hypothetical protein [Marinobacter sp. M216]